MNPFEVPFGKFVEICISQHTCVTCGTQIPAGLYDANAHDYTMLEIDGVLTLVRRFIFIASPCKCDRFTFCQYSDQLTNLAQQIRERLVVYFQEYLWDAEKLPFPKNLEIMKIYKRSLEYVRKAPPDAIMNMKEILTREEEQEENNDG